MEQSSSDTLSSDKISNVSYVETAQTIHIEEWRKIPDWPYEVSSFGNVRRIEYDGYGPLLKGGTSGPKRYKYPNVILSDGQRKKTFLRHHLVALVFMGPTPAGMEIDHKDGDRFNYRLDNLEFKTPSANIMGAVERGHRGANRWNAKLTEDDVRHIRQAQQMGLSMKGIAEHFHIPYIQVYHVCKGNNWRHVA